MNANEMERYCKVITDILWDSGKADTLIARAAEIVNEVACGDFHRDNIRTQPFTEGVIARCKKEIGGGIPSATLASHDRAR
jgi:hypothetical protein